MNLIFATNFESLYHFTSWVKTMTTSSGGRVMIASTPDGIASAFEKLQMQGEMQVEDALVLCCAEWGQDTRARIQKWLFDVAESGYTK